MADMAAWGDMSKRLKIGGHWFDYYQTYLTKFDAKHTAMDLRSSGIRAARVVPKTGGIYRHTRYHVYVRNK